MNGIKIIFMLVFLLSGCAIDDSNKLAVEDSPNPASTSKKFNLVAKRSQLAIDEDVVHQALTFNGTLPGPLMIVNEGDEVEITIKNEDTITHGLSVHAANTQTSSYVGNLQAGATKQLKFKADSPGVYMYHCAPGGHGIMSHTMAGMFGMLVVEPKPQQYTLEQQLARQPDLKIYIVQHETYSNGRDFFDGHPVYVTFNGYNFRYVREPIAVRPNDYIRFYYLNVGPNLTSTFHAVGGVWDYIYYQGNPANQMQGAQSVIAGPTDSYVIEWLVPSEGPFTLVSHALGTQAAKGAIGILNSKASNLIKPIISSEGPSLPLPEQPKRVVDPFGIGTDDLDKVVRFHAGDHVTIQMVGNSFFPKVAEIPLGTEVTWSNEDVFDMLEGERTGKHNLAVVEFETDEPKGKHDEALEHEQHVYFASPELKHADKFRFKFSQKGVYQYICPTHPYMKGKIKVY